jgi:hypothetical protein
LTLQDFRRRLSTYPPGALREAKQALEKIEQKRSILYRPSLDEIDSATKELLIAILREASATKTEIAEVLKRAGFDYL